MNGSGVMREKPSEFTLVLSNPQKSKPKAHAGTFSMSAPMEVGSVFALEP